MFIDGFYASNYASKKVLLLTGWLKDSKIRLKCLKNKKTKHISSELLKQC